MRGEVMSQGTTQISANISKNTKERMERYAREYGVKKAFLIESALQHHLNVLDEVPSDVVIPPSILVTSVTLHDQWPGSLHLDWQSFSTLSHPAIPAL